MNSRNLISVLFIFVLSCEPKVKHAEKPVNQHVVVADTFMIADKVFRLKEGLTKSDFDELVSFAFDTSEVRNLLKDSALVKRSGDTLTFKIANGKKVTLADNKNTDGDEYADYDYMGYLTDIKHFVVFGAFYEWYNYLLISEKTGDTILLRGEPVLSPDKKLLVSGNLDLVAGFTENGFELYSVENATLKLIGKKELSSWGPQELKWKNNTELWVERSVMDSVTAAHEYTDYARLLIE